MRLRLHPDVVVAWRNPGCVQIGLGSDRGLILDDLTPDGEALLAGLRSGEHSLDSLRALAAERGLPGREVDRLVDALREQGAILAEPVVPLLRTRAHLLPVARAATLRHPGVDGWTLVHARLAARILLVGTAYFGSRLARMLVSAGIGEVGVHDRRPVSARDLAEGEVYLPSDLGRPRHQVLAERVPGVIPHADAVTTNADLVVLIGAGALEPMVWDPYLRTDTTHLPLLLGERDVVVGPLVRPGQTCCLRCLDLFRADRDPAWPTVAVQAAHHRFGPRDPLLLDLACVTAAAQLLLLVDEPGRASLDGVSLEVGLDDPVPTLRRWPAHPRCGCTWPPAGRRAEVAPALGDLGSPG